MSVSLNGSGQTILQVVNANWRGYQTTTSQSFVTTSLSATITPFATTSKILILCSLGIATGGTYGLGLAIYKNSSQLYIQAASDSSGSGQYYSMYYGGANLYNTVALNYLDSPSTTSATTYAIYFASYGGNTAYFGIGGTNFGSNQTMTLLEVSGA
jgi:hypothetical protein